MAPASRTLTRPVPVSRRHRRGRPTKYGGPSQVVAITLPRRIVKALGRTNADLGWAIVSLVDQAKRGTPDEAVQADVQLVGVGHDQSLIIVDMAIFRHLPGVQLIPLSATHAFLALDPGLGMPDLELAALDRVRRLKTHSREHEAMSHLIEQLRTWRHDPKVEAHLRSIILLARRPPGIPAPDAP